MSQSEWVETYCVVCRGMGEVLGASRRDMQTSRAKTLVKCERCGGTGRLSVRIPSTSWSKKARSSQLLARTALRVSRHGH